MASKDTNTSKAADVSKAEPELLSVAEAPNADGPVTPKAESGNGIEFLGSEPFAPLDKPKVAPLYKIVVRLTHERTTYSYKVTANDEADAIRQVFDFNEALKANIARVLREAKRVSWTPVNVEQLTVDQVEKLNNLTDEEKLALMERAIPSQTKAA